MEELFSTQLKIDSNSIDYRIVFKNEKYIFNSESDNTKFLSFSFRREHNEWIDETALPAELKTLAIDALENYLLQQH